MPISHKSQTLIVAKHVVSFSMAFCTSNLTQRRNCFPNSEFCLRKKVCRIHTVLLISMSQSPEWKIILRNTSKEFSKVHV